MPKIEAPRINIHDALSVNQSLIINLNREQTAMLLRGLDKLSDADKQKVVYIQLRKDLESIIVIWDRRIKNENILRTERRIKSSSDQQKPLNQRMRVEQGTKIENKVES